MPASARSVFVDMVSQRNHHSEGNVVSLYSILIFTILGLAGSDTGAQIRDGV